MDDEFLGEVDLAEMSRILEADGFSFASEIQLPRAGNGPTPVAPGQARLWYLAQLRPQDWSYNLAAAFRTSGGINPDRIERSFARVLERHLVLNCTVAAPDGQPFLELLPDTAIRLNQVHVRPTADQSVSQAVDAALAAEICRPFDLGRERPIRLHYVTPEGGAPVLAIIIHHIAADGWSMPLLLRDFLAAYRTDGAYPLPALPVSYRDVALWQQQGEDGLADVHLSYWFARLQGCPVKVEFPFDGPRTEGIPTVRADRRRFRISRTDVDALASRHGVLPYAVLLAAYGLVVGRYSGLSDLLVAGTAAGRSRPEFEEIVGLFANTVPHRLILDPGRDFAANLARLAPEILADLDHQDAPFDRIVADRLGGERTGDGDPLCQIAFVLQNYPSAGAVLHTAGFAPLPLPMAATRYDLSLVAEPSETFYEMTLYSRADRMSQALADGFCHRLVDLIASLAAGAEGPVRKVGLRTEAERVAWTREIGAVDAFCLDLEAALPLAAYLRAVELTPDAIAVIDSDVRLTYAQLHDRACRIASAIAESGIAPGQIVGLCLPRSADCLAAVFAVWMTGAAFMLIDPRLPPRRQDHLVSDSKAALVVTTQAPTGAADWRQGRVLFLDLAELPAPTACVVHPGQEDPAYVIYTSGSTGHPKGAIIPQRGIATFLSGLQTLYPIHWSDRVLFKAAMSFDVAVWEMLWPLTVGAMVVVAAPGTEADPTALVDLIHGQSVTVAHFVPPMLSVFLDHLDLGSCPDLRLVFAGGEALPPALIRRHAERSRAVLVNSYGPSETSIGVTHWPCPGRFDGQLVPIGLPMPGVALSVRDTAGDPVPTGTAGELWVHGPSVGAGYIGRPDLTAAVFLPDPDRPGWTAYATGDRVRRGADGQILFLGRRDSQIKLRGQRIEPAEIEAALGGLTGVSQSTVLVERDADTGAATRLLAVAEVPGPVSWTEESLRAALLRDLPEGHLPARIACVQRMPVTLNGKVDRTALLNLFLDSAVPSDTSALSGTETMVAALFGDLLGAVPTRRDDGFFQLGGHSLLAIQVLTQVQKRFGVRISLAQFLDRPTIGAVADHICANQAVLRGAVQPLRPARAGHPTVALFHPALGISSCYSALAAALPENWGVLTAEDAADYGDRPRTIEDRACGYAGQIQTLCPSGPLILGGWSLGGLLACAVEKELARRGRSCQALLLIDSHLRRDDDPVPSQPWLGFLRSLGLEGTVIAQLLPSLDRCDEDSALQAIVSRIGGSFADLGALARIYRRNAEAARAFRPAPSGTPALCAIATRFSDPSDMRSRWASVLSAAQFLDLAEDHEGIVRAPAAASIAASLRAFFEEPV